MVLVKKSTPVESLKQWIKEKTAKGSDWRFFWLLLWPLFMLIVAALALIFIVPTLRSRDGAHTIERATARARARATGKDQPQSALGRIRERRADVKKEIVEQSKKIEQASVGAKDEHEKIDNATDGDDVDGVIYGKSD